MQPHKQTYMCICSCMQLGCHSGEQKTIASLSEFECKICNENNRFVICSLLLILFHSLRHLCPVLSSTTAVLIGFDLQFINPAESGPRFNLL